MSEAKFSQTFQRIKINRISLFLFQILCGAEKLSGECLEPSDAVESICMFELSRGE